MYSVLWISSLPETRTRTQSQVRPEPVDLWIFYCKIRAVLDCYIVPILICHSRGGGVLDHHSGPVPEHQHHVHPLSESTHASRTRSKH